MGLPDIIAQVTIIQAGPGKMLNPFHPARGQIGRGPQTRLLAQNLIGHWTDLKGHRKIINHSAANGKDFAADFPDMRPAPLNDIGRRRQFPAKGIERFIVHRLN